MKAKFFPVILFTIVLLLISAAEVGAQHEQHGQQKPPAQADKQGDKQMGMQHRSMDMTKMMREPHHVLAMTYLQNVANFTRALRDQVKSANAVDEEFARSAVAEIRRNFDAMQQHLGDHKKAVPADMGSHAGMIQEMDKHVTEIRMTLELLEKDVQNGAPVASKVAGRADEIVKHIEMMTGAPGEHKGHHQ